MPLYQERAEEAIVDDRWRDNFEQIDVIYEVAFRVSSLAQLHINIDFPRLLLSGGAS